MKIIYAPLILPLLLFFFCTDEYSVEIRDAMIDTVSGNQNVVIINYYYDTEDWKNVMDFDITLKNDVRMYIAGCKRNKNGEFIYRYVSNINNWSLYEIIHYEDSDKYESKFPKDTAKDFLGNNSLEYLLENYQKLYDFYMSVPEFSAISYNKDKETFDNIPDEFVFDVYDEESCKVIGVGKLYRVKKEEALTTSTGQLGFSPENGKQGGSRGTYTHMFVSTVAYGGTIFWKKNPDYMRAKGEKEKRSFLNYEKNTYSFLIFGPVHHDWLFSASRRFHLVCRDKSCNWNCGINDFTFSEKKSENWSVGFVCRNIFFGNIFGIYEIRIPLLSFRMECRLFYIDIGNFLCAVLYSIFSKTI